MSSESPVGQFVSKAQNTIGAADLPQPDPNEPKVPFATELKLTAEQEKKMLEHAFKRLETLSNETGRNQTLNPTWWMTMSPAPNPLLGAQGLWAPNTFLGKRARYDATYYNDVSWRPWTMGPENIFMSSNFVVPLSRRICRQMVAKAKNSFFGSDPWFSIDPAPTPASEMDDELAMRIERFCRFKLNESNSKDDKTRAIERALVLGECAVKTSYVVRDQLYNVEAMVLTDIEGQPVKGQDGNNITPDDEWVDAQDGQGTRVLKRDGTTPMPEAPTFQKLPLNRRQVLFEGARSEPIYYKDFLCPLTATDVQTADCIVHMYDKPVMEFVDLVVKRGMVDDSTDERLKATQRMISLVQKLSDNSNQPKAAVNVDLRPNENFSPLPSDEGTGPVAEFAEFYFWYDANGDGIAENIMLIADRKNQIPVFYDHVANVTTDGLRPVEIVRINPVEGRWYGLGVMELFESYQTVTDLLVNRWNFAQSRAGRVDFWTPTNTLEGEANPHLKMNWGGTYTKKPNCKVEDVLQSVYLNDTKFEQVQTVLQFFMQLAMNESGVTNANDNYVAGMEQAKLATGINQIERSGNELFQPIVDDLVGPLTRLVNREVDVTLANLNPEEVFTYLEGDTLGVDKLTPDDVRGLKFKVTIELTTHKNQQQLAASGQAATIVEKFYSLPPQIQVHVVEFYRNQIRALDPKCDADKVIQPIALPPQMGIAPGQPGQADQSGAVPAPTLFPQQAAS